MLDLPNIEHPTKEPSLIKEWHEEDKVVQKDG